MRLYKSLFILTIVLLFSTCAEKPTEVKSTGEVQGRVLDIKTGAGIENATVTIPTISDKLTDISGFYQFKDIEEGTYSFVAEKTGYVSEIKQIVIEVNETKEVNFQLMIDEPVLSITPSQINFGTIETIQTVSITNTGTGSLTWSASENINWLSVSPTSGSISADDTTSSTISVIRAGLDQGIYEGEIAFVSNGGNDTLQVQMEVVPTLVVSESSLDFGTELTLSTLIVTNPGGGNLEWTVTNTANWLTISPTSGSTGTEEDVITLLVDRTGLDGGDYSSTITFTSNGGNYTVSVVMRVPLPPALLVSPSSLDFGASTSTMNLNIINNGDGVLTWNVTADQGWLSTSPTAGETTTETDQVSIMVDRNNLEVGDYSGNITITTNGGNATIPVLMEVTPVGLIVSTTSLDFGDSDSQLNFTISNSGIGELAWTLNINDVWISTDLSSGTITSNSQEVIVYVARDNLDANSYNGSITVESNGGNQSIIVSMIVVEFPAPELQEPTNITENSMDLAWTIISDSDFQEYRLYRSNSTGVDENSTLVATITNAYENFYNDTGLDGGTSYYYRVYSASTNGVTAGSNEISAATSLELGNWGLVHSFDNSIYLNAIYAFSDDNVWVVGEQVLDEGNSSLGISVIYHYAQGDWIEITCPDIGGLSDIDFSSPSNGWAVGGDGAIHYNGVSWTMDSTLSSYYSYGGWVDVDVNDDNDVWFVSPDQGIRHLYNGAYSQLDIDRPVDISVNNDNNFGVILTRYLSAGVSFYDGFSWTQDTAFTSLMDGYGVISKIIMFDDNDFIMLSMPNIHPLSGPISALLYYNFNEESWTTYPNDEFYSSYAMDALSSNYIWLMAFGAANNSWNDDNGFTIFWDGSSWRYVDTPLASPQFEPWSDIDFFEIGTGWGCGGNKVYRYN